MDILPTNILFVLTLSFKILFVIVGIIIVLVNYLHASEARKMERRLSVHIPGSVHLAMSLQLYLSAFFVLLASITLLFTR